MIVKQKRKKKTRDLILETALTLFNAHGAHKVSTNHIAGRMGISPGNLYYYFKNKEHILRELLARLIEEFNYVTQWDGWIGSGMDGIIDMLNLAGEIIYRYRFMYSELAALLAGDDLFRQMYQKIKTQRVETFARLIALGGRMGFFQEPISPAERDALVTILWTYAEGIVTALRTGNTAVTPDAVKLYLKKSLYLFKPSLRPDIWRALSAALSLE